MKCPLCNKLMTQTKYPDYFVCKTPKCYNRLVCDVGSSLKRLQLQIDSIRAKATAAAAPHWRPFDLEKMRKSLPVIVTSKDSSMDYTLLIRNDAEIDIKFRMGFGGWHKEDLAWMPVPKVEEKE